MAKALGRKTWRFQQRKKLYLLSTQDDRSYVAAGPAGAGGGLHQGGHRDGRPKVGNGKWMLFPGTDF